ncbi:MAG: hypothetical protein F6J87_04960 [Spirulina sp. SIO3F2]|nr:hypothetical protein [Spirulina sp. SIO3F2]
MTPTLNLNGLTPTQIQQLQTLADQFRTINKQNIQTSQTVQNGKELLTYWQHMGVINSLPKTIDSQQYARQLRDQAQNRKITQF